MFKEIFIVSYIYGLEGKQKNRTESRTVVINHKDDNDAHMKMHENLIRSLRSKVFDGEQDGDLSLIAVSSLHKEEIYG